MNSTGNTAPQKSKSLMKGLKFALLLVILLPVMFSCRNPVQEERSLIMPADSLIPEPVMIRILADVHILEAGLLIKRNHGQNIAGLPDIYYRDLFRKYRISDARFASNLKYYQWDPEAYNAMYEKVIAELKARKTWIPGHAKTVRDKTE